MTEEEIRGAIAAAIFQSGYDAADEGPDAVDLFQWHHCFDNPNCGTFCSPPAPCPCSGVPYLSDAVWAKVGPVVERASRVGYGQAIATLLDVARRTGSPAAKWAADYLDADPDRLGPPRTKELT